MGVSPMRPTGVSPVVEECRAETALRLMGKMPMLLTGETPVLR